MWSCTTGGFEQNYNPRSEGKDIFRTRLIFPPSHFIRNILSPILPFNIPLTQDPCYHTQYSNTLPSKQPSPLLRVYRHTLLYIIFISPIRPILPAIRDTPNQLLTTLPTPIYKRSRYTNLLYRPTRQP